MNRSGFELAISTLVVIVLGVFVLIGLIYVFTDGFSRLGRSTAPLLDSAEISSIRQACDFACTAEDTITYCCKNFTLGSGQVLCSDSRIGSRSDCSCAAVTCPAA